MREFTMPRLSLSDDEEMIVARWLIDEGTLFEEGDPLLEVETAKAVMQVEAPGPGVLARVVVQADQSILPGELLAWLADDGEALDTAPAGDVHPADVPPAVEATAELGTEPGLPSVDVTTAPVSGGERTIQARKAIINRIEYRGSGELYGLPTYRGNRMALRPIAEAALSVGEGGDGVSRPLTKHRSALARLMTGSAAIPQFSVRKHVPMDGAVDAVSHLRERGLAVTLTDVLIRATALALIAHPEINAHYTGDAIRYFTEPVISIATDSPNGVIAPVMRHPQRLSWSEIVDERRRIVEGARAGKLPPTDLNGGTFSLSNIGAVGGDAVVPLLVPPQIAILGVGAVRPSTLGSVSTMELVGDHRALDGADAARFLVTLVELLRAGSPATSYELGAE